MPCRPLHLKPFTTRLNSAAARLRGQQSRRISAADTGVQCRLREHRAVFEPHGLPFVQGVAHEQGTAAGFGRRPAGQRWAARTSWPRHLLHVNLSKMTLLFRLVILRLHNHGVYFERRVFGGSFRPAAAHPRPQPPPQICLRPGTRHMFLQLRFFQSACRCLATTENATALRTSSNDSSSSCCPRLLSSRPTRSRLSYSQARAVALIMQAAARVTHHPAGITINDSSDAVRSLLALRRMGGSGGIPITIITSCELRALDPPESSRSSLLHLFAMWQQDETCEASDAAAIGDVCVCSIQIDKIDAALTGICSTPRFRCPGPSRPSPLLQLYPLSPLHPTHQAPETPFVPYLPGGSSGWAWAACKTRWSKRRAPCSS